MTALLLAPPVLSFLLLGAHFYRSAHDLLVGACVALAVLACVPRRWAAGVARVALALGALEWVRTTIDFARDRAAAGQPWLRLVLILGGVGLFTLASSLVFSARRLRDRVEGGPAA